MYGAFRGIPDFAEEDIEFVDNSEVMKMLEEAIGEIDRLEGSFRFGKVIKEGAKVALVESRM